MNDLFDDEAHDARIAKYKAKCQADHDAKLARDEARHEAQAVKRADLARAKVLRGQLSRRRQRVRKAEDGTRRRAPLSPERRQAIALAMRAVWKARKQGARQSA